jgi:hypothetical protein
MHYPAQRARLLQQVKERAQLSPYLLLVSDREALALSLHVCRHEFLKAGFAHHDLFIEDCSCPRDATVHPLIDLCV